MPETRGAAGARAAVLARLWGALAREPIAGLYARERGGSTLTVTLDDRRTLSGRADVAAPFSVADPGFALSLNGVSYVDPGGLVRALRLPGECRRLATELDNSVGNLALARGRQPEPAAGDPAIIAAAGQPDPLAYLEQCVVDGHPLHPCCRTRMGLSPEEVLAYGPEHRPLVELTLLDVPPDRWLGIDAPPVLAVHPWQRDHVLDRYRFLAPARSSEPGSARVVRARPLMSLRTLALDRGHHVKTAVDVQMTSAVRTVSPAAVHNGPAVSRLMQDLLGRTPAVGAVLGIMPERSAGAVIVDGAPCRSLAVLHREMPRLDAAEVALPLAVFAAPSPADGRPIVAEVVTDAYGKDPVAFLDALATLLLPPLFAILQLGVALEAHGQNLLVVLRDGRPARLLYRDFGGIRISPHRLDRHGIEVPPLRGDLVDDDPDVLRTKLFAAVMTVLGEVISVLGREFDLDPDEGWLRVASSWRRHDSPYGDGAALFAPTIPVKATTAMRLATDPLEDIWASVPNPLAGMA